MSVESNTLWAEWNSAFETLKLAHEKLRGLAHSPPEDTERTRRPRNGLTPEGLTIAPAPKSRFDQWRRTRRHYAPMTLGDMREPRVV